MITWDESNLNAYEGNIVAYLMEQIETWFENYAPDLGELKSENTLVGIFKKREEFEAFLSRVDKELAADTEENGTDIISFKNRFLKLYDNDKSLTDMLISYCEFYG